MLSNESWLCRVGSDMKVLEIITCSFTFTFMSFVLQKKAHPEKNLDESLPCT